MDAAFKFMLTLMGAMALLGVELLVFNASHVASYHGPSTRSTDHGVRR